MLVEVGVSRLVISIFIEQWLIMGQVIMTRRVLSTLVSYYVFRASMRNQWIGKIVYCRFHINSKICYNE